MNPGQADLYILGPVLCRCESIQAVSHLHQPGEGDVQGDFHIKAGWQCCSGKEKGRDPATPLGGHRDCLQEHAQRQVPYYPFHSFPKS